MSRSLLVALSVAVLLIFALSYHLTRPLEALRYMCNRIAEGDYSVRISEKRKDEIGELARTMNAMAARIEKNLRQSTDFFTNVSHELKTPLASIQGHAEALLDKVTISPEESRSYLEIINREAVRMSRLSGNLLDIARFEDGRVVLAREMVNLSALAGEVADGLRIEAQKKGVTIHARVSDSLPEVSADGARLHQVLSNLVENAIKYGQENGDIWIESGISSRQVRISVRDRGPGIPPEEIPRIFDRFYRIEKSRSRKAGGSGLGLALSRLIVEAHGGTLTVESALNEGTTFTMSLPAKS
jgi:signal transduction histidine kinase